MSTLIFTGRLGRDGDLRYTPGGDAVINLAVAYNYGRKGQDDKRPTQWVDCSLFGKRAEALAPYLIRGQQLYLILDDVHIRTYQKNDNTQGFSLSGSVSKIELIGGKPDAQQPDGKSTNYARDAQDNDRMRQIYETKGEPATNQPAQPAGFDSFEDDFDF